MVLGRRFVSPSLTLSPFYLLASPSGSSLSGEPAHPGGIGTVMSEGRKLVR